jgi:hypothetical protein
MKKLVLFCLTLLCISNLFSVKSQAIPSEDENIPYLMTFGNKAQTDWGDDDFSQTFFFLIPKEYKGPVFFRVYDPDCGDNLDELDGKFDTQTSFTVYGGKGCYTVEDARKIDPVGNYKSGNMLKTKTFGVATNYDGKWYSFGPFNPTEGELVEDLNGYVFKMIIEGIAGDDGNLYRFFLSSSGTENKPIEGGNGFAYEYSFRMWDNPLEISHIYPYVDDKTTSVKMANFDWDDDGNIRIVSVARKGQLCTVSNQNIWALSEFKILEEEKNTSLDIQLVKKKSPVVKNNNVVIYVQNQYGEMLRFYAIPLGGVPKYKYSIGVKDAGDQ